MAQVGRRRTGVEGHRDSCGLAAAAPASACCQTGGFCRRQRWWDAPTWRRLPPRCFTQPAAPPAPACCPLQFLRLKNVRPYIPDFKLAFEHFCIHTGGRGVIDAIEKQLELRPDNVGPSRETLFRYGNVSSASIWCALLSQINPPLCASSVVGQSPQGAPARSSRGAPARCCRAGCSWSMVS